MATNYSIKDLETLSGIKAHTIRMWEQRYGILKAHRTPTNIRYYSENELKYLLSIALLNNNGYKISKLSALTSEQISDTVNTIMERPIEQMKYVQSLILATIDYDETRFEKIISTCILQLGFEETMIKVVFPFLEKIGILWITGSVMAAQEHFVSHLIRQKIIVAIDGQLIKPGQQSKKFLLFLPNGEWHELSLLFLAYMLKARNHKILYLGPSVPLKDVLEAGKTQDPDYFYTILTTLPNGYSISDYLNTLAEAFPQKSILASGTQLMHPLKDLYANIFVLNSLDKVIDRIDTLV